MPSYVVTFVVNDVPDESEALVVCSERLAANRDFEIEELKT
ncbi:MULTISPECIES: hypothetical protein [Mycolicibacterium]|uniref:Uncharacterized protein n=1 Tax=Mycolicibacterium canariasense TaxID=228230 RepID=A0A100WHI0_MYCCR|nr:MULTISPECIES: hypothetical protein [Mycolicibacterium]GAS98722.1 unnamed protein product [Mycolicibacterium canariasense]